MRTLYIGGQRKKKGGSAWKIYAFLFLLLAITGTALNAAGPMIVERWLNQKGNGDAGHAFSVRDVELSLATGQIVLKDVKIFNPDTYAELLKSPGMTIQVNWSDLLQSQKKNISISADKVDLILSKDFSSEMERIQAAGGKGGQDLYLDRMEAKFGELNIIEQKVDQSRKLLELNEVSLKLKEVSLLSINKKTEFSISSSIVGGGKLNLTGKTLEENGTTPWSILGTLKQVPPDIFNKIAGDKLPFSFDESSLNANISARSDNGAVSGEIAPDVKRLNLLEERPGVPARTIARALTEELTFTLAFTLKDKLTLQYADTYRKLRTYRKYPGATEAKISKTEKSKKAPSFWPF